MSDDRSAAIEALLRQYTSISDFSNLAELESYLKSKSAPAASTSSSKEVDDLRKQLYTEKSRVGNLDADLQEAKALATKAEAKAKEEEEKKAKSISLLKWGLLSNTYGAEG